LKFSDYQVVSVKKKTFCNLHTCRWLALRIWEVVGGGGTHAHMRTCTHGNPASQQNQKKNQEKTEMAIWKKRKEHPHCSNAYMRTCAHAQINHSLRSRTDQQWAVHALSFSGTFFSTEQIMEGLILFWWELSNLLFGEDILWVCDRIQEMRAHRKAQILSFPNLPILSLDRIYFLYFIVCSFFMSLLRLFFYYVLFHKVS
jgi:hypothetical protein